MTGKISEATCEDGIVVTDNHIAVIDGSTSKAKHQLENNIRNGRLAMLLLQDVVRSLPKEASLECFCHEATQKFHESYIKHGISDDQLILHPEERLTASIAIYSHYNNEIWLVGDCQCIVNGTFHDNPKPDEDRIANKRSEIIKKMISNGTASIDGLRKHDLGREAIVAEIAETCHWQNKDFSVVDGFNIAMNKVKTIHANPPCEVILGTDGYPYLLQTLEESEQALAQLLSEDPLCINQYKATKGMMEGQSSFDDRTYIRFHIQ